MQALDYSLRQVLHTCVCLPPQDFIAFCDLVETFKFSYRKASGLIHIIFTVAGWIIMDLLYDTLVLYF